MLKFIITSLFGRIEDGANLGITFFCRNTRDVVREKEMELKKRQKKREEVKEMPLEKEMELRRSQKTTTSVRVYVIY